MVSYISQKINNTIFKTYEDDLNGISNKIGFSKRSFAEWGAQVSKTFKESEGFVNTFKNTLKTMLFAQTQNNKNWHMVNGNIVTKDNLDFYIPNLNTDSARIELENLQNIQNEINRTKGSWDDYNNQFLDGKKYLLEYAKSNDVLKASVDNIKQANQQARESVIAYNNALQQQTFSAKATTAALSVLRTVGNMVAFMLISKGIELAITTISNYINRVEKLKEAAEESRQAIDSIESSFKDLKDTTNDIKQRYAELSQGIDQFSGENLTLSTESYEEFLNLSNQLAELFPTLTKGYDENGNAILNLSGNVNTIVDSLNNLIEAEREVANQEILKELPNIYEEYEYNYEKYNNGVNKYKGIQLRDIYQSRDRKSVSLTDTDLELADVEKLKEKISALIGEEVSTSTVTTSTGMNVEFSISDDSEVDISSAEVFKIINQELTEQKNLLESETASFNKYLNTWLSGEWLYVQNSDLQNAMQQMLFNSDWIEQATKDGIDTTDWNKVSEWLRNTFLSKLGNLTQGDAFNLSRLFTGELSPEETLSIANELQKSFDEAGISISLDFITDIDDNDSVANLLERVKNRIKELTPTDEAEQQRLKQQYEDAQKARQEKYNGSNYIGNVDINNRPILTNDDGTYSTTSTVLQEKWIGDEETGSYKMIHITPILPDGTILTDEELDEYINRILQSSDPLEADKAENGGYGIVYKVDTEVDGEKITDKNLDDAIQQGEQWDVQMHEEQAKIYEEEANALLEYNEAIELTKYLLEKGIDTESEYEWFLKITEGAETAKEAIEKMNEALNTQASDTSIFGNELNTEEIDSFQEKANTLSSALEQMNSGDFDDNALADLLAQFPELEGETDNLEQAIKDLIMNALDKLYEALGGRGNVPDDIQKVLDGIAESATGAKEALNKAFPDIQASYDALKNYEKAMSEGMTDEVLSDVASLSDELYGMVAGYYANIVSADELYTALQNHYQTDLKNYGNALIAKNQDNVEFCDAVGLNNAEVTNQFMRDYGVDLKNHKTYAEKKLAIEQQLLTNVAEGWARYYNAQTRTFTSQMAALENQISQLESFKKASTFTMGGNLVSNSLVSNTLSNQTTNMLSMAKKTHNTIVNAVGKYEAAIDALNNVTYNGLQSSFEGVSNTLDTNSGSGSGSSSSAQEDSIETLDWIETKLSRIQRIITNLGKTVDTTWRKWTARNTALVSEMNEIQNEINLQQQAYDRYLKQASSVGLSSYYQNLVKNGTINIQTIQNDALKEQVDDYTNWYNKALDCSDAILDLKDNLADLAQQKFDNVVAEFEDKMSVIEHEATMIEGFLDQTEAKGYLAGFEYYEQLTALEKNNIALLEQEYAGLRNSLQESIDNGTVEIYSESWYEMTGQIFEVQEAIQEANSSLIEYSNNMRELDWEIFDKTQEYISKIQEESEFLIGLMENETLFDEDTGNWTEYADATAGLHAVNYNAYMSQANDYAKEIQEIDKALAEDPYNTLLIERRQELLSLQQDMINNAESEKQSIIDLVSEGYDVMLNALQEIIDKRKEELQIEKDIYDYQKEIENKTKTVNSLQKQLESYSGFDDEETKAKIQQISVQLQEAKEDLEATEYDKWLTDQQQMLDSIIDETESWINERLDQIDLLISEVIDNTNANAGTISETIERTTDEVGYTLTEEMRNVWLGESGLNKVVTVYGDNFNLMLTTTNTTLTSIRDLIQAMVNKSNEQAKQDVAETKKETAKVPGMPSSTPSTGSSSNSSSTSNKTDKNTSSNSSSSSNSKWGHWFVSKKDSYPKSKLNIEKSIVDETI